MFYAFRGIGQELERELRTTFFYSTRVTHTASPRRHIHFVTGKLAAPALRSVVNRIADEVPFEFSIGVMPITVAALMTPAWIKKRWQIPSAATEIMVPGYVGDAYELQQDVEIPVQVGPKDLRALPEFFGAANSATQPDYGQFDIRIVAEINHAPDLSIDQICARAQQLIDDGADVIDIGCNPGRRWRDVGQTVRLLTEKNFSVSIDTFDAWEAEQAVGNGASLVLSVNASNRQAAIDWGCEVVAIPDTPDDLDSLEQTVAFLEKHNVPMRLDPILEPIGVGGSHVGGKATGFIASLLRYASVRQRFPQHEIMMGIGNLTELTDVDSAGVNVLLLGICQELGIRSVLTTEVINWARSAVRECDAARRLVYHAVQHQVPPKRLDESLVMLRDAKLRPFPPETLDELAAAIKDNNYRLFAQSEQIHLLAAGLHLCDADPFALFAALLEQPQSKNVDAGHAFYLGFEMAKALTALTLGKQYEQDEALSWGLLTRNEEHHRLPRKNRQRPKESS
ncbi:Pterin binding enzyme [Roseimaritima ulvae]|uniref:Pterin binding enzyme n=1 Tax=Roseimaritima ulvae TaxID=980254 RepID=A0A5B9QK71_9BACT|nr:Pterin binding enzyme [Roseimaritima ulvae]